VLLVMCCCCSGKLEAGTYALNANKGKKERIGRLMMMHANNRWAISGVVKLLALRTARGAVCALCLFGGGPSWG